MMHPRAVPDSIVLFEHFKILSATHSLAEKLSFSSFRKFCADIGHVHTVGSGRGGNRERKKDVSRFDRCLRTNAARNDEAKDAKLLHKTDSSEQMRANTDGFVLLRVAQVERAHSPSSGQSTCECEGGKVSKKKYLPFL